MTETISDESAGYEVDQREIDPDPISVILEIANLAAGAGTVATAVIMFKDLSQRKKSDIRRALFEIDRAINKGFAGLMILASLLNEFSYLRETRRIGGSPIIGFKNAEALRRTHEDCRAAVKEARDAFINLSALLPLEDAKSVQQALIKLNELSSPILDTGRSYGVFLVAASFAFNEVDKLICGVGEGYGFDRSPRDFAADMRKALPNLPNNESVIGRSIY